MNHTGLAPAVDSIFPEFFTPGNEAIDFVVQDIAVIMVVAAIMLAITFKLKQPMVIGYIIAGMVIGPYTPPFSLVHSPETLNLFAELGIIMLLFVTGTEFPIAKLRSVGRISIVTALADRSSCSEIGRLSVRPSRSVMILNPNPSGTVTETS